MTNKLKKLLKLLIIIILLILSVEVVQADTLQPTFNIELSETQLQNGQEVKVSVDWQLYEAQTGDRFNFKLPEQLINHNQTIDLINENGVSIATSHRDGEYIVFTFNEEVDGLYNLHGNFWFMTRLEITDETVSGQEVLEFEVNGEAIEIPIIVEETEVGTGVNDRYVGKHGLYNQNNEDEIDWVVEVNGNQELVANTRIIDKLGAGHELVEGTLSVNKLIQGQYYEQDFTVISEDLNGYEIEVYLDSTIVITYKTKVTEKYIDHTNSVLVQTWDGKEYDQEAVAYFFDSGGTGSGVKPPVESEEPKPTEPTEPEVEEPHEPIIDEPVEDKEEEPKEVVEEPKEETKETVEEPKEESIEVTEEPKHIVDEPKETEKVKEKLEEDKEKVEPVVFEAVKSTETVKETKTKIPDTASKGSYLSNLMILITAIILLKRKG